MDFASVVLTEAVKAAPHYTVLAVLMGFLMRALGKSHKSLVEVAKQSAEVIGQNSECLREVATQLRGLNGHGPTRQQARPAVMVGATDDSVTSS